MELKVSDDNRFLIVTDATKLELEQLEFSFTKKVDNWWIIKKKMEQQGKSVGWGGEIKFMDRYNRIPIGLWLQVINISKEYKFQVTIVGQEHLVDTSFDPQDFRDWVFDYFANAKFENGEEFFPYDFQITAAINAIKYRFCVEEISTSGGKTLISFMIFKYLLDKKKIKKMLYIVPNVDLVGQSADGFLDYDEMCGNEPDWKLEMIFSSARNPKGEKQVTFGTFQSLSNKTLDFFKDYDMIICDEVHHAKSNSIKSIITKCYNATWYRIGLTGTLPKEKSTDFYTIQAYLGPKVYTVSSADLIDSKRATPINVVGIELNYLSDDIKKNMYTLRCDKDKDGVKLLNLEKQVARDSRKRFNYIVTKISSVTKNTLVLFADIKYGYGKKIYDWLRANTDKNIYYIDGSTKKDSREHYKKLLESEEDVILVASTGTFSEGISVNNLHTIFITESNKSENIIRQILGRGMRLKNGKDSVTVIDFSDNYIFGSHKWNKTNYLIKHSIERGKIYNEQKFPYKKFKVNL
jgi:superfamily II DNA or RNA helicase